MRDITTPPFSWAEPAIHGVAGLRAETNTIALSNGDRFAGLTLTFVDAHGQTAELRAFFVADAIPFAHRLADAINGVSEAQASSPEAS